MTFKNVGPLSRAVWVSIGLLLGLVTGCSDPESGDYEIVVFHTNDRHSHWLGLPNCDCDPFAESDQIRGGGARWMNLVNNARQQQPHVMLLDAGDFSMGTMLVGAESTAADLNLMREFGFNAAALGNHEFDWGAQGLVKMLQAAEQPTVPLLCANIRFSQDSAEDDALQALYGPASEKGKQIHPYLVQRIAGIKVGIFGLMGLNAASVSNASPVTFSKDMDDLVHTAQSVVTILREQEKVELVLLLAHLGIVVDESGQLGDETVELAKKVWGIDAILSGHDHTSVAQGQSIACELPDSSWTTLVMESGCYGTSIGRWNFTRQAQLTQLSATLIDVDSSLGVDQPTADRIFDTVRDVEQNVLSQYPLVPSEDAFLTGKLNQPLAQAAFDLPRHGFEANNLGYFVADAVAQATDSPVVAISNGGDLRASLERCADDRYHLGDVFISVPLGMGLDGRLGYPLVQFYLNWSELKFILLATVASLGWENNDYMLSLAGLRLVVDTTVGKIVHIVQYNPIDESDSGQVVFDHNADNGGWGQVDPKALVKITTSAYIAQFLSSFGFFPRDEMGVAQNTLEDFVVFDSAGREQKLWYLTAKKLASYETGLSDQYNDDVSKNPYGPYWRRMCDVNPDSEFGHTCP